MERESSVLTTQPSPTQSDTTRLNLTEDRTAMWGVVDEYQKQRTSGASRKPYATKS
jgi:hypothetical protein